MLRHTMRLTRLLALRKSKDFEGEPLLYEEHRLGHSDATTTMIYLHSESISLRLKSYLRQ